LRLGVRNRGVVPRTVNRKGKGQKQGRVQLFVLAYNLGNFLRRLGLPKAIKDWSLRSLQVKLIKMGGRIVRHARQIVFQLAEVAVPRELFAAILERISRLRLAPG